MARPSVRQLWKAKIEGRLPTPSRPTEQTAAARRFTGTVLGVDPSLRGTGLAVIEFPSSRSPVLLYSSTLKISPRASFATCLGNIFQAVEKVLSQYSVDHFALEQTIFVQNVQTAQILGAARGAAIAAAAIKELPVFEYPPLRVKQAVVGVGRASKEQVAKTVMGLLGHGRTLALDEADAAAVAICHAFTYKI